MRRSSSILIAILLIVAAAFGSGGGEGARWASTGAHSAGAALNGARVADLPRGARW